MFIHPQASHWKRLSLALIYLQETSGYGDGDGDGVSRRGLKYWPAPGLPPPWPPLYDIDSRTLHPPESSFIGQKREKSRKNLYSMSCRFRNIFGIWDTEFLAKFSANLFEFSIALAMLFRPYLTCRFPGYRLSPSCISLPSSSASAPVLLSGLRHCQG